MPEGPLIVVSPHLDDGVLSCGGLLSARPGSIVLTVFAGRPAAGSTLSEWDRASGFCEGEDVIGARRTEDRAALAELGATPIWLDFRDSQYGDTPHVEQVAQALEAVIADQPMRTVLAPLGLFHSDHRLAAEACLQALERLPDRQWLVYADAIYRRFAGLLDGRLAELAGGGWRLTPITCANKLERKQAAVAHYRSQILALGTPGRPGHQDAFAEEWYWRLTPPALMATGQAKGSGHERKD